MTEATLNLVPLPGRRAIAMAYFPTVFAAGETVFPILDLKPTSLEIMDANFLRFVRKNNSKIDAMLPPVRRHSPADRVRGAPTTPSWTEQLDRRWSRLLAGGSALQVKRAMGAAEQKQLWAVRQAAVPLLQKLPGPKTDRRVHRGHHRAPGRPRHLHEHAGRASWRGTGSSPSCTDMPATATSTRDRS